MHYKLKFRYGIPGIGYCTRERFYSFERHTRCVNIMTAAKNVGMWHRGIERGAKALDNAWRHADLRQSNVRFCFVLPCCCFICFLPAIYHTWVRYGACSCFYFWAANPSRCFSCLFTSFFYLIELLSPFPSAFICISLFGAFLVLVLIFLYHRLSGACLFCFRFLAFLFWVPSWQRYPLQATCTSGSFSLLYFHVCLFVCFVFSDHRVRSRFVLVWLRLSCDHSWIRSGSVRNER